ncbi:hypothetical protein VKT23_018076 [Stygiomarasmius scandens]|uniref:Uncharacterized protein n=1 Tax=Marasmiellus scandens TaxID=2682957 RepID=A0ABR1ITT9_9AGAR
MEESSASLSHVHTLESQVGGHAGVQTTEDGSLIIKPALPLEHKFYQQLTTSDDFDDLRPYVPRFYGTLKLEGEVDQASEGGIVVKETESTKENKDEYRSSLVGSSGIETRIWFTVSGARKPLSSVPETQHSRHQARYCAL